jgi:hypothetical protein
MPETKKKRQSESAPKARPVPTESADQCKPNDGKPDSGPRKPKCREGYPEQQPPDQHTDNAKE